MNTKSIARLSLLTFALVTGGFDATAQPTLVSANPAMISATAGGDSVAPIISRDGRFVLFSSSAGNLITNTNGAPFLPAIYPAKLNVFLYDRTNGSTALVSANTNGSAGGSDDSFAIAISTNAQFVLFESAATNLVSGDTNGVNDVFVRDLINNITTLVSVSTNGGVGSDISRSSTMTADGRYVAFVSAATNLVAGDTNGIQDVFVRDLQASNTVLVSVGAMSSSPTNSSESPDISDDGRYVAFYSTATNLVPGVATISEIYVRDLLGGATLLASTNSRSFVGIANVVSCDHILSANGQYVAYLATSNSSSWSPFGVLIRYHVLTGATDVVSSHVIGNRAGYEFNGRNLDMTPDGNFIAFVTNSGTRNNALLVWNAQSNSTTLVSSDFIFSSIAPDYYWPQLSDDGRYVTFFSSAILAYNGLHLYVYDSQTTNISLVDPRTDGSAPAYAPLSPPSVSSNGQFMAFDSFDPSLVTSDANRGYDVFVRDLSTNTLQLISGAGPTQQSLAPNGPGLISSFSSSSNARYIAFTSEAENLVTNDTNFCRDVFVHDTLLGTNILVSVGLNGFSGNNVSSDCAISADGRYVAFTSSASNLVAGDNNNARDVFVRDLQANTITLVSVNTSSNGPGNADSYSPLISADGRYILFHSKASNLAPGFSSSGFDNLFRRDLQLLTTFPLTTNTTTDTFAAAASPDGRFVAYGSGGFGEKSYVWDMQTPRKIYTNGTAALLVAVSPGGTRFAYATSVGSSQVVFANITSNTTVTLSGTAVTTHPTLQFSADNRYLLLGSGGTGKTNQIVLYDSQTGLTNIISTAYNSSSGANGSSDFATISPDGHFIAYRSAASNIVPNDLNGCADVFLYNRLTGQTALMSSSQYGSFSASSHSFAPVFSPGSQTLLLTTWAADVASQDFNQSGDILAFNLADANAEPTLIVTTITPGTLAWPAVPGKNYQVQFKNNLTDATWQNVSGNVTVVGNQAYLTDLAPSPGQKFYQVVAY